MLFLRWKSLQRLVMGVVTFVCVLSFVACSAPQGNVSLLGETSLRVATAPTFPPFSDVAPDGSIVGFDIDLMNAIAEVEGFDIELKSEPFFDDLIRDLYGGVVDAAVVAITITPERQKAVDFSQPYFQSSLAIAVQSTNDQINSVNDLQDKRIGVEAGTTSASAARTIRQARVVSYDTAPIALAELAQANVDAVINDAPALTYAMQSGEVTGLKMLPEPLMEQYYGIAVAKGSPHLERINSGLETVVRNGRYAEIYRKWFQTEPPRLPTEF
ncbi:basic amino acid ABC transporter substrate-binding protein [Leptolyngbya sp. AN02str]|uniref:basic amino acid ABC transporter substrate-binding protein n=1 Tax=Leptolyngbya sp. AN02str TaxID=3423363 RepID=UPI003D30FEF2